MSEYNLKAIREEFKQKGIYYTPPELVETIKSYVTNNPKNVYDPTCGDGALLAAFGDDVKKYGQEIDRRQLEVAEESLVNFTGYCGDTLKDPSFRDQKFDCIVANPPFSISWEPNMDERFFGAPTIPTRSKADYAFILHILHYLSCEGIAVVLCFPGVLYRGNRELKIREWMLEENYIEKVISIPGDTFVDTKIGTNILVLNKNKFTTDVIFESKELNKSRTVTLEEITKNDYTLSVNTYIQKEVVKEKINPEEIQNLARNYMLRKLEADLTFDKQVCKLEPGFTMDSYLNDLQTIIDKFR